MLRATSLSLAAVLLALPLAAQQPEPVVAQTGSSYSLGPGDVVRISVWGREDYSGQFQVNENGLIHYPVLGEIDTNNMTIAALRDTLRAGLEQLFTNPFVTITPLFKIAVLGEVQQPGLYTVDPTVSILDLVAMAGGASRVGNLNKIRVLRAGTETRVSFERETMGAGTIQDIGVRSGDAILVPRKFFTRDDFILVMQLAQIGLTIAIFINTVGN